MAHELSGLRVALLTSNAGVEQAELTTPWQAVTDAGATPELIAPGEGQVQAFNHLDKGDTFTVHRTLRDIDHTEYDALVVPGGVANGDFLRMSPAAVSFARRLFEAGKPAAVICHGPWVPIEGGLVRGRTLTSWPSLKTRLARICVTSCGM
jgi:protease I